MDLTDSIWPIVAAAATLIIGWGLSASSSPNDQSQGSACTWDQEQLVASVERTAIKERVALLKQLRAWLGEAPGPEGEP